MALDFGHDLFPQQGLLQEDGILSERWNQQGSNLVSVTGNNHDDNTIYTVTSGKIFYVKTITVTPDGTPSGTFQLKDNGSGGTIRCYFDEGANGGIISATFVAPLKFDVDVYCNEIDACNSIITLAGWEEDE